MRRVLSYILTVFILWLSGYFYYIYKTESYIIDNSTITNAIVVSTGTGHRIETAIALLKLGYAPILFIVGLESKNQLNNFLVEHNVKQNQVIYATAVTMTQKERAKKIANFIMEYNLTSIRLVTSSYDMPIILEEILELTSPSRIHIIPHPIQSEYNKYSILLRSYNKYLQTILLGFIS